MPLSYSIPQGIGSRWTYGAIILTHLIVYNETGGIGAVLVIVVAAFNALLSVSCKYGLKHVKIEYLRASHRLDFLCLYIALWMDILCLLAACGGLARTLSSCIDTMTGGIARMYLLGRNEVNANEAWPDVVGVAVIFLLSGMFMLGLENTQIFSVLMISGVLGITGILSIITWLSGSTEPLKQGFIIPKGISGLLSSSALSIFCFPHKLPTAVTVNSNGANDGTIANGGNDNGGSGDAGAGKTKLLGLAIIFIVFLSNTMIAACLSTLIKPNVSHDYEAVPMLSILNATNFPKVIPAVACLLVLSCSGALLELFPEMYNLIVKLTKSTWKVLPKQIGFENRDSGSPVLAIFTGGSLCAMLAFACPLENLTHIMAASSLLAGCLRTFYFLYSPLRPKGLQQQNDSSLAYSRLGTSDKKAILKPKKTIWFFNKDSAAISTKPKPKVNKAGNSEELEREWLLLGEPPSPKVTENSQDVESILSDLDVTEKIENTDSDSSTDIDAIVDEYRQKIKVSTAGPMDNNLRVPSLTTWRIGLFGLLLVVAGVFSVSIGILLKLPIVLYSGILVLFLSTLLLLWLPKQHSTVHSPSIITCILSLLLGNSLFFSTLSESWPAILFWFIAGFILFVRCDTWCCLCLDARTAQANILISNHNSQLNLHQRSLNGGAVLNERVSGHR